ncbi:MAG: bifunctional DNA primase/polymerase [Cypionkella sp.]
MSMPDHALIYAACGLSVFPIYGLTDRCCDCGNPDCSSPGKHSTVAGGFKSATTDFETILCWRTASPKANIGIATGAVSGIIVLDVDVGQGKDGLASLKEVESRYSPIPKSATVRVGGDGWHFYLRAPSVEVKDSAGRLAKNIDIRGCGGYVIAPLRSIFLETAMCGKTLIHYFHDLPDMTEWWIKELASHQQPTENANAANIVGAPLSFMNGGSRNNKLTSVAVCLHQRHGLDANAMFEMVYPVNMAAQNPLHEGEVRAVVNSVAKYPAGGRSELLPDVWTVSGVI